MMHKILQRSILISTVFLVCRIGWGVDGVRQGPANLDIIDCHTHFYDPERPEGVPWPEKGTPLYRTVLPEHLRALKTFRPVTGTIIVEARARIEDNAWLLDLAKNDPFIVGIVGRLEPGEPSFEKNLKRFAANPLFRGIRISVGALKQLLEQNVLADLKLLAAHDLSLDVNGGPETPAVVAKLASKLPELRIVLNHIGNVPITDKRPDAAWSEGVRLLAEYPNVFCKISGLVENAAQQAKKPAPAELDFYRPYLDVVWNAFGEDRVIYGSNWPVSDSGADYKTLQSITLRYAFERGEEPARKFCSLNALRAYHWIERSERR